MDDPAEPDLPRGVALAWGIAANPQRGPKRELSIERIVDAAIGIADAGGLAAVSMAGVAAEFGFSTMSLYRYVSNKDELVMLMGEQGYGIPPESVREADGWREALRVWSREQVGVYELHPWLLDIAITGTPVTPNSLAWLDVALEVLEGQPLDSEEKLSISLAVLAQTRWQGSIERGYREAATAAGRTENALDLVAADTLKALVTAEHLPFVRRILDDGALEPGEDDPFAFGLDRVLDGIERYIDTRPAVRERPAQTGEDPRIASDAKVREAGKRVREAQKALAEARKAEREARTHARDRLRNSRT
ncbi:TetR/AcrR family transcriptional regulator [Naasia lichenicola]|uniref:TetR/AcrR family transcriptional regulator n=1 Tax=Naasia lichenicola TaxID=2565933 RepID=A0A4S4FR92_9MICO|nr:TetR/AcrR family transcriptional regulator [Naasia lichenicola]THG32884.1 TetR/AcrR family transcriptional regulator [Naasia lichenicola]